MLTVPIGRRSSSLAKIGWFSFLGGIVFIFCLPVARAQAPSPASQTPSGDTSQNAPKPDAKALNDKIVSHDSAATLKVRVNLVLVRVVVRDNSGKVVTNLKKEDFQLSDNRKPQVISTFSAETPESHKVAPATPPWSTPEGDESGDTAAAITALPQRLVGVVVDDTDMLMQATLWVRSAETPLPSSL